MTAALPTFKTHVHFIGLSSDGRTNRWRITCPKCGKDTIPPTTMLPDQQFRCERGKKCNANIYVNYNDEIIRIQP